MKVCNIYVRRKDHPSPFEDKALQDSNALKQNETENITHLVERLLRGSHPEIHKRVIAAVQLQRTTRRI